MSWRTPWALPGKWYRGNLHAHTTESDGALDPAGVLAWYREHGYDFAAITDHNKLTDLSHTSDESFLVLPGIELNGGETEVGSIFDIVGLGITRKPDYEHRGSAQDAVDAIRAVGGEAVVAHSYWSGLTVADLREVRGALGMEIFNTVCLRLNGKGQATVQWDDLLARGYRWWGLGVDDAHWRWDDHGQTWVVVKARRLEREAIMRALREGHFYSTRGPRITALELFEGEVRVTCSAVAAINFICDKWNGRHFHADGAGTISRAEFTPPESAAYVRVECVDHQGRAAWSNPIYLREPALPAPAVEAQANEEPSGEEV